LSADAVHVLFDTESLPALLFEHARVPFKQFARLPAEIQLMVWKYAVPDPRDILDAFVIIVNFNLNSPRAILPSPKELQEICGMFLTSSRLSEDDNHFSGTLQRLAATPHSEYHVSTSRLSRFQIGCW
jgi:hypothetical protein